MPAISSCTIFGPARRDVSSVNLDRGEANGESLAPVISGDGQFVAFTSTASNLVPGDTNGVADVFVADLYRGLIQRVSVAGSGTQSDRDSYQPSISHDGRYIAFTSGSRTFDSRDRDEDLDVYLYDRARDSLTWISRSFGGEGGNGDSHSPAIGAQGGTVAFVSSASNLFPGDVNGFNDVFVWDAAQGQVRPVTRGNGPSAQPSVTHDGSQIWFSSQASDLVANDTNYGVDLFVFDRELDYTQMVGQATGEQRSHFVVDPQISADGSTLVFASYATDLVPDDANTTSDIFVQSTQGVYRVQLTEVTEITGLDFGNEFRLSTIRGQKFADVNGNGQRDVDSETGEFVEPGLNGWTIRLVDSRTGQTWETTTESIDLNGDGVIDPIVEQGIYEFGPLEPETTRCMSWLKMAGSHRFRESSCRRRSIFNPLRDPATGRRFHRRPTQDWRGMSRCVRVTGPESSRCLDSRRCRGRSRATADPVRQGIQRRWGQLGSVGSLL